MTVDEKRLENRITQAHKLDGSADVITKFYADWAEEYNKDLEGLDYKALSQIVHIFRQFPKPNKITTDMRDTNIRIIDVGCGTGFLGQELRRNGYTNIDGLDLSPEMVEQAKKSGVFKRNRKNYSAFA